MRYLAKAILGFIKKEDGPTAVEYAVMLALIILVCLTAVALIGNTTQTNFNDKVIEGALKSGS